MVRYLPFAAITAQHIEELKERAIPEDHTLDYKLDLRIEDRDERSELLKDIVAFANASGGTLLYAVKEGTGDQEGMIVECPGLALSPDPVRRTIDNLLRDSVDERIPNVLHRAVPREDGRFYYVIRVAASPLAPHMVTLGPHRSRFFLRGNTTNDPMNARQIKEVTLRAASAVERANAFMDARNALRISKASSRATVAEPWLAAQVMLHVVPLFPHSGGWAFSDDTTHARLAQVPAFGYSEPYSAQRLSQEGLASEYYDVRHVKFLRNGAVEFQRFDIVGRSSHYQAPGVEAWQIEQDCIEALDECALLSREGLLPVPVLVGLTLSGVAGVRLIPNPNASGNQRQIDEDVVRVSPILVTEWGPTADMQIRSLFDEMYQAWGFRRSTNYDDSGQRDWWVERRRVTTPRRKVEGSASSS